jgi:hypothetical protein
MMRKPRHFLAITVCLAGLAFSRCGSTTTPPVSRPDAVVTVDASAVLRTVEPGLILGANLGCWELPVKLGASTQGLFRDLRPSTLRFPGGNLSNNYCWVTQKVSDNAHVQWDDWSWGIDVDHFLAFSKAIGCVPMFSLNPFDHTIDGQAHSAAGEAGDLAAFFVADGFPDAYYEVGNENDGDWNPMLSVEEYTDRFILLVTAVKGADPAAQSMGPVVSAYNITWINGFLDRLQTLGALGLLDWISYHHYGGWISNDNQNVINLNDPQDFGREIETIRDALAAHGVAGVKVAVTEMNAAIWDTGCTRDQLSIHQALWLADALGTCFLHADASNVWIDIQQGSDPHSLIDDGQDPPRPTRNYWPVALAVQTLSSDPPSAPVSVLTASVTLQPSVLTAYAVRKSDGSLGILLLNKGSRDLDVAVELPGETSAATGRRLGPQEYTAGSGPAALSLTRDRGRIRFTLTAASIVGLDVR